MIILFISIPLFNFIAYKANKIPTLNRIVNIWIFTNAFQLLFDVIVEFRFKAYWYFDNGIDLLGVMAHMILIPPVNIILLGWFPFHSKVIKQAIYIACWTVGVISYEALALLPEPWGFFHFGWWRLWYDVILVPILILILLSYYKWICKVEQKVLDSRGE